jgi:2',3'-cyclic-nucleotide 2'-phosphodiesterase (5'-nucleotidase family)
MHRPLLAALLAAALAPVLGCVAYNDPCQPLVEDPEAVVAYLGEDVPLGRNYARHDNHAIAQAAADAFRHVEDDSTARAELGIINGGAIRAEGLCTTRTNVRKGPLKSGLLHEILLFENQVVSVDLTEQQLVAMMEHSVGGLAREGQAITSPPGAFLHISEGSIMRVDCALQRGSRVTELTVAGRKVSLPARDDSTIRYRVAMSSFVLDGGDGYGDILGNAGKDPTRNPVASRKHGGSDANIVEAYMKATYASEAQALKKAERIVFLNCAKP